VFFCKVKDMNARKKILIAPLDWGLGHATRCIPIVQELLAQDFDVILAGDHRAKALLGRAFPDLPFEYLPGYAIRYAASAWALPWVLLQQVPRILHKISLGTSMGKAHGGEISVGCHTLRQPLWVVSFRCLFYFSNPSGSYPHTPISVVRKNDQFR
jgi:hypothetical protein